MRTYSMLAAAGLAALVAAAPERAAAQARTTLDIYVVDVEGGNATLLVAPSGELLLIDTGNFGPQAAPRDAARIMEAARDARLTQIDHLITTHWHNDHFGGMEELAKLIPIKHFIDHGPNQQPAPDADAFLKNVYPRLIANARHTAVKVGDKIPIAGLDVQVVTSNGGVLKTPLAAPGAGTANPYCALFKPGDNNVEDPLSVGVHITFGKFRTMHLGDLTKNKEFEMMCPSNPIGTIDVFLSLHHGLNSTNSEAMLHAIAPRVAIINNGTRKGGQPDVMRIIHSSPGLEDLWQIHFSILSGQEYSVPGMFIANGIDQQPAALPVDPLAVAAGATPPPAPVHDGPSFWIKVSAKEDGSFTVTNARNKFSKTYAAKPATN